MEYGQIFHVTRTGKYYCKNMRYRINIYIYVYVCTKKNCTRDPIYLKVVATDFFPKIISPSAGENSGAPMAHIFAFCFTP